MSDYLPQTIWHESEWWIPIAAHEKAVQDAEQRIQELERRLRIPFGKLPCGQCGGPHDFEYQRSERGVE